MLTTPILECYKSNDLVSGISYGQWTVRWWKWALSMPATNNPLEDTTGENAFRSQPKDVWFLAGTFGKEGSDLEIPLRTCTVPARLPILIPVLNCQADKIDRPYLLNDQEILNEAKRQADSIVKKICEINGVMILPERVVSDPTIYDIMIHQDFTKEKIKNEFAPASADGYWVFIKGLDPGHYSIRIAGACEHGEIKSGASYSLTVI
jgi:hypothetical protein